MIDGQLVPSAISGHYALDNPNAGRDLTAGDRLEIYLNGQWITGRIEYASNLYAIEGRPEQHGYYFVSEKGGTCGLCVGMRARIPA